MGRSSFGKLQRDRDKRAKAAAKREKRLNRGSEEAGADEVTVEPPNENGPSTEELLKAIEALHQRFDDNAISYEDFEEQKADLMGRLTVE